MQSQIEARARRLSGVEGELQEVHAMRDTTRAQLERERGEITRLQSEVERHAERLSQVEAELQQLRTAHGSAVAELQTGRSQLVATEAELYRFRASHNLAAEELEEERARHSKLLAQLHQALTHQETAALQAAKWQEMAQAANAELALAQALKSAAEARALAAERQSFAVQRRAAAGGKTLPICWIASYPRSGNTWLRALISCLEFGADSDLHTMQRMIPDLLDVFDPRWIADRQRLLAKSHFPPDEAERHAAILEPASFTQNSILIVRHPFDVAIACYDMMMLNTPGGEALAQGDTRERFAAYFEAFALSGGSKNGLLEGEGLGLTEFVTAWRRRIDEQGGIVVTYESLLANPLDTLARVAATLEIPADASKLLAAVQRCSFERLRADEEADIASRRDTNSEFFRDWREEAYKAGRRFFNVGRSDRWKSVLTPEQVSFGARHLRQAFEISGYRIPE